MRLLLDTHVYLWWLDDPDILSRKAIELIENPGNTVFISAAISWEIYVKKSIGKLDVPDEIMDYMKLENFLPLPVTIEHTQLLLFLEHHHYDPFDRILLVQAKYEKLTFLTRDKKNLKYKGIKLVKA